METRESKMAPTQKTYQNITSIDDLNKQIHLDVPVIFLISTSFLNTNDYHHLFSLIAKYKIEWLIFIGDQAEIWEDKFDELLETESINHREYLLDVVTTHSHYHHKENIEEIISEFLVLSCIGLANYQLISFLDCSILAEEKIFHLIQDNLSLV